MHPPRRRGHAHRLLDALVRRGNRRQRERRRQRDRREHHLHRHPRHRHRGNRHPHHGDRGHRGHLRQDHQGRRARLHRRRDAPDDSDLFPGWAAGAASCRDSAAVRRCLVGRCGSCSGGYLRLGGEACCWVQVDSRVVLVAVPTNAAARNCRRRRDCCLPAGTSDPASATADGRLLNPRAVHPAADRPAAVEEPLDVPPPGAQVPPAGSAEPGAPRRQGVEQVPGAPLGSRAAEALVELPPETLLVTLGEAPERTFLPVDGRAPVQDRAWQRFHQLRGASHQRVRDRWSMRRWRGTACPHRRETSREACGRPVPPPLKRRTSHTRLDRRVS